MHGFVKLNIFEIINSFFCKKAWIMFKSLAISKLIHKFQKHKFISPIN